MNFTKLNQFVSILAVLVLMTSCTQQKERSLLDQVSMFKISECQRQCGVDSVGIRKNEIKESKMLVRLGYIVNCSWEYGYLEDVTQRNDTLFLVLDRPHKTDTLKIDATASDIISYQIVEEYSHTDCDCFFYIDLVLKDFPKALNTIRVKGPFGDKGYWDERPLREIVEIEEIEQTIVSPE